MKRLFVAMVIIGVFALISLPAFAEVVYDGTLFGQEGTTQDGYSTIIGSRPGHSMDNNSIENWIDAKGWSQSADIYSWGDGWLNVSTAGTDNGNLDVEADIEMYISSTIENHKMYFHIGNIFTALQNPGAYLTAIAHETFITNHPMWVGVSFDGSPGKTEANFVTTFTDGRIKDAMVGKTRGDGSTMTEGVDGGVLGHGIKTKFDATILRSIDYGATWQPPAVFGDGADGTLHRVLWWARLPVTDTGVHQLYWLVQLHPNAAQQDGNYHLDPVFVAAPEL